MRCPKCGGTNSELVNVKCHTNVDEGKLKKWPTQMACRPAKGERVRARDGCELVICEITHAVAEKGSATAPPGPYLLIELAGRQP